MTRDINVLKMWLMVVVTIAAAAATMVPVLYSLFPWRTHIIGRLFMVQAISFAAALDLTVLFQFWMPADILVIFWIEALIFTGIAISTSLMAALLLKYKLTRKGRS